MTTFILLCHDKPDALSLRMDTRPTHLTYIKEANIDIKVAGAMLDPLTNDPMGSMFIIEAEDTQTVQTFSDNDPYAKAGLFMSVDIRPYRIVIGELAS